jgi:23S rRNA (cytosine1962-C5)-methyltransferase
LIALLQGQLRGKNDGYEAKVDDSSGRMWPRLGGPRRGVERTGPGAVRFCLSEHVLEQSNVLGRYYATDRAGAWQLRHHQPRHFRHSGYLSQRRHPGCRGDPKSAFKQHDVTGTLTVPAVPNISGAYNLDGGVLTAATASIAGTFTRDGGTFNFTSLVLDQFQGVASYSLSGANSVVNAGSESLGVGGQGDFSQSNGANNTTFLVLGVLAGFNGNGTYELSAGTLSANNEFIGSASTGTFTQSGTSSNTVTTNLFIGGQAGVSTGTGTYNLNAGALTALSEVIGASPCPTSASVRIILGVSPRGAEMITATFDGLISDDPKSRPVVMLEPGRHRRVAAGHPWVYSNEIKMDKAAKALSPGSLVTLRQAGGEALGVATFNPHTLVAARILDRDPVRRIDRTFFIARLEAALALRRRLYGEPYYRLVHAEADGLPGIAADRFGEVIVTQLNTAGTTRLEAEWLEACDAVLAPSAIVLRNDSTVRALEGLGPERRIARGEVRGPVELLENGARFLADTLEGQKTGWFFDQRDNRRFIAGLSTGARVLDLYCFAGGFAVQAALAGADAVLALDRSEAALALAAASADRNAVGERCHFQRADAFEELARLFAAGERFGVVIADPPAFVKSKKDLGAGLRGYRKLARLAASLVESGGLLFIASCSHNVEPADFAEAVRRGLEDAARTGRILRNAGASPDHPVHPWLPESAYLKSQVLVLD